jgi:hypothetical protein
MFNGKITMFQTTNQQTVKLPAANLGFRSQLHLQDLQDSTASKSSSQRGQRTGRLKHSLACLEKKMRGLG